MDSPLAVEATNIFMTNTQECFDEEAMALVRQGINPIRFPGLRLSVSVEESRAINEDPNPRSFSQHLACAMPDESVII